MRILFDCSSLFRNGRVESGIPTYSLSVFELLKKTGYEVIPFYSGLKTYGLERIVGGFLHLPLPTKFIQVLTFCGIKFDWMIGKFGRWVGGADSRFHVSSFKFQIFFTPNISTFYRYFSSNINVVGVVHDLSQTLFPELKPWRERWKYFGQYKTQLFEKFVFWNRGRKPIIERFHHLIAISEHTKRDLVEFSNVPEEKITVIYPHGSWNMDHGTGDASSVLKKFYIHKQYLLFLGHIESRKNVGNLICAFSMLKETNKELQLVIAGRAGYGFKNILRLCKEFQFSYTSHYSLTTTHHADVIFTDHITDEEKYVLMQNAEVFVYPSLYEGFAYPCLEAMSVGTPVVTSPVSALPEVLGDAALYADPLRPESIAAVVEELLNDSELRTRLIEKGRACAVKYQNSGTSLQEWNRLFKKL